MNENHSLRPFIGGWNTMDIPKILYFYYNMAYSVSLTGSKSLK